MCTLDDGDGAEEKCQYCFCFYLNENIKTAGIDIYSKNINYIHQCVSNFKNQYFFVYMYHGSEFQIFLLRSIIEK